MLDQSDAEATMGSDGFEMLLAFFKAVRSQGSQAVKSTLTPYRLIKRIEMKKKG